jgi:guanyl-specific ribonuclease Sa
MIKNTKLALMFTAALVLGGFSAASSAPGVSAKDAGSKPALAALAQSPGAPQVADLSIPVPAQGLTGAVTIDRQSGNNNCTPSQALIPGSGFSPSVDDQVRNTAIIELLQKIATCQPLPYSHDGITNTNTEGGMPQAPAGFYKEYTLMVPGRKTGDGPVPIVVGGQTYMTGNMQSARGPERIIIGGGKEIYYTMDHYKTFLHLTIVQ